MSISLLGIFFFLIAGASTIYALVITNQTNTNVVLSYGIWDTTSFDLTADLESATGPVNWSTSGVPDNVSPVFSNTSNTGATLTLNQLNNGPNAGNYQMYVVATAQSGESTNTMITITVQQRAFSIRGSFTANNKTYDRTASATIATNSLTPGLIDVLDGDDVALVPVATFANANAGNGKTVSISASSTLTGAQAGNYYVNLSGSPTTTATISQQGVTITPPTFNKTYDRSTTAIPVGSPSLNGVISGDTVTISGSPTFTYSQASVGTGISVTPSVAYGLSGTAASNYSLTQPALSGDITKRSLSITFTGTNKTYDGTATATVTASSDTRISGDVLGTISASSALFTQSGIGTGVTINISGITGSGSDAGNYTFPTSATTTADITARSVTIGGTLQVPSSRAYDKTVSATISDSSTLTIANAVSSDLSNLSLSGLVAQFATKTVGTAKTVSITSASLSGAARFNYNLTLTGSPTATADITRKSLVVTITASNKTYDGTTTATVSYGDDRIAGDSLTISGNATFDTKAVGTAKPVTATSISIGGTDAANYLANTTASTTADVTSRTLTIGFTGGGKTYDGTTSASVVYTDTRVTGDNITITGTATYATKTAATGKQITAINISVSGPDSGNYSYNTTASNTANITARSLTVGITSAGKTYDRTTAATVTYTDDRISGDVFTVSGTAAYGDKTAAVGKTITATGITLSGTDAANYAQNTTAMTTATISKRTLIVSITSTGKTYDASVSATVTYTDDRISGDVFTVSGTAAYGDKTAAVGKTITATGITLSGTDAANYVQNTTAATTATVTRRALTINGTYTASNKTYDATTTATVTPPASPTLSTIQGSDSVSLTGTPTFSFAQSGVGSAISITTNGYSLGGTDANNYTLTLPTLSANITTRTLTISGTLSVSASKVYDGSVAASFVNSSLLTLANVPAGDSGDAGKLALASPVAQYATKTVGTSKTVSVTSASLSGTSASNYTISVAGSPTTTANITSRALTISATGINKTYNGLTNATVTLSSDKLGGDTVSLAYTSASFSTKIVESGKPVSVSGISISGTDAANYSANTTASTTASILARVLTVSITASNKIYDANTSASVTYGSDKVAGDSLNISGIATFANKSVGTSKPVTATSISVTGTDASNYTANSTASTTASITAKSLVVSISASNKTYDGNTTASVTYTDDRIAGDAVSISSTPTFNSSSVGTGKTVTASSITLGGADGGNYSPNTSAVATADITARTLNVTISGGAKTYDASTSASVTYSSDKVSGDTLTITGTATYADKLAATGKQITATGISIGGTSAPNYVLASTTATTTATISKRTLTITGSFVAANRVYDGTTDATGNVSVPATPGITPVQGSDDVILSGTPIFTYASSSVGTSIAITGSGYSLSGADSTNYTLTQLSLSSNITLRTVTIGGSLVVPSTKTYNSTAATTITDTSALTLVNTASPDAGNPSKLALNSLVAQYANKNVGDGKIVSLTSAGITGTSAGNYSLSTIGAPTTTASITLRTLDVTITATSRVYNATTAASVTYSDNRVSGDVFTVSGTATFDSKNFGNGKTVTANDITLTGTDAANYSQNTTAVTTASITRRPLTVTGTFTVANRPYDATTDANAQITLPSVVGLSDVQAGDDAYLTGTPTFTFSRATVGTSISISTFGYSVAGADSANYSLTQPSFAANITQRPLTIGGTLTVTSSKVYNRSTAATITDTSLLTLENVPAGDANDAAKVALTSLTAAYDNKNVGIGKPVSVATAALTGTTSSNYTITTSGAPTTTADITQRAITLGFTPSNKTYDGTTNVSFTYTDTRISGDVLTVSGTPAFADKNVGTNKTITAANMSITGTDAANYSFNTTATATATISVRSLSVSFTASNKIYDGNASASVVYADTRITGDVFTVSGTATFSSKTYGLGKNVTATGISLSGTDAANYSANTSFTATASITKRALTISITASNKTYDRTTTASVTYQDDRVTGDVLTITSTPTFNDKNVGVGKAVTANSISISGTDAGNYSYNTTASTTADITKRSLTIGIVPSNKVYNANTTASVTYTDNRVSGDALTFSSTATFNDKNVGVSKPVTAINIAVSNTDAGNYDYNSSAASTATITKRPLTVTGTFTVANRQYDATTDATAQVTLPAIAGLSDVQMGDDASLSGTPTFTFAQANVGTGIAISTTGYSVVGLDADNYALTQPSFSANITTRPLTIGGALVVSSTKVYDKGITSSITDASQLLLQNVPAGDTNNSAKVSLASLGASYSDKNVGVGKTVSLTAASLTGTTSSNYTLTISGAPTTTADITRRSVTISITPSAKTYDGTDAASVTYQDTRISGDVFAVSGTATFSDKNVAVGKQVTAVGITLSGTDAGNYSPNTTATNTATISRRSLAVTTTGVNKVYDRTTAATVVFSDNRISGDVFTYSATSTFNSKMVGTSKPISTTGISLLGTDSGNYTPNTTSSSSANITARQLAVTITASNKTYDGSTSASVSYLDDRISGDIFTVSGSASFDNKNIGTDKTVTAINISISGADSGNYSQNTTTTTTANITARTLVVTAAADSKVYDATVNATAVYSDDRVAGDVFTVTGTATFSSKTAATGKTVSVVNISISGTDAGNYTQNSTATSIADITQRPLEVTGTLQAQDKVYDGSRTATYDIADLTLVGVQGNDLVGVTNPRGRFRTNANVGVNKIVELTSFQFTGADLGNYAVSVNNSPITYASITPRTLDVTISPANKIYDGTTSATVTYLDNRVSGDVMTVSGTSTFSDKNVGTGKTVTANNITLTGTASGNYSFNSTATSTANITTKTLAITITASNKTYDGNTDASVVYLDDRISGDIFVVSGSSSFSSKTVGTGKTVTASGITLTGTDAANYTSNSSTTKTANILPRSLNVTITASDKIYDKSAAASVLYSDNRVSGDIFTVTGSSTFSDKNVGIGKTVTSTGIAISGIDAPNYTQNTSAITTATITPRALVVNINASNKVYNASTAASVTYSDNRISGDLITITGNATFDDKTAAIGKTVTATGITLSGADANNYSPNSTAITTANVTRRPLTVTGTFTVISRQYDATTDATDQVTLPVSAGLSDVQGGDDTTLIGTPTFTFSQATVGTNIGISTTGYSLSGADADNYSLTSPTFAANITQRPLTIGGSLITSSTKNYDRTRAITITDGSALSLLNVPSGDANAPSKVGLTGLIAQYDDKTVADGKTVTLTSASLAGSAASNYTLSLSGSPTTSASITARTLNVTIAATNKTYNGNSNATVTYTDDRVSGDIFTISGTSTFSDKNIGTAKNVTATGITLTGTDAANYSSNTTAGTTANINARTLNVTITASNKTYDRTTSASVVYSDDRVSGDIFTVSGAAVFNNKNVGVTKNVTATGITLTGTDAANYSQNTTATTTADITSRTLNVTITGSNKTYDGNSNATVTYTDDRVSGDVFTISGTSTFSDKNIGTTKNISATGITLTGTDASNYTHNTSAGTTANITSRTLNITITASNKTYDGNANATVTYTDDRVSGDVFSVSGAAVFNNKNVGNTKNVAATGITLTGTDAANYTHNTTAATTANITRRTLVVSISALNKTYNGNSNATVTYTDDRVSGDIFTISGTSTFSDKNVGTAKNVTATGITLTGTDAANYTQNTTAATTANIAARTLVVSISALNKTYDGNASATVTYTDNRVNGDIFTISGTAVFNNKNVGATKNVSATGITLTGTDSTNYSFNATAVTTANIIARTLNVTIAAANKIYDGNANATVTYTDDRVNGDIFTISGTSTFSDKNVGTAKNVTATGISLSGTDAANYTQNTTATTTANITTRTLNVTITANNKTYDQTSSALVVYADNRVFGDIFEVIGTSTFSDKNVGTSKNVTATGITLTGTDAANYTQNTTATTTANITARTLNVTITATSKIYDGNANATVAYADNRISGDTFIIDGAALFNNKNVGNTKNVTATGITLTGTDAANYTQNTTATTTANITARTLNVTITATSKIYDGNSNASVTYTDNRVTGDIFSITGTSTFSDKNVGSSKNVTVTGITLTGTDAANYSQNTTATTTADITSRTLNVTITASNKTYDGTTSASVVYVDDRVSGDIFTVTGTTTFSDKNVGTAKNIVAIGIAITGTDAANYTQNTTAATTANIVQRPLLVAAVANDKTYDATNTATVSYTDNRIDGDSFTITSDAVFDDAELGRDKPVSITNITLTGVDASNYQANLAATSSGDISVRGITASIPDSIKDVPLSDSTPTVVLGELVPSVETTVTFTKEGSANVVCSLMPQNSAESCTSSNLADGTWKYRARQLIGGLMVAASEQFSITIDTTAPSANKSALIVAASDSGASNSDGITNDNTPSITIIEASPTDRVVVSASFNNQVVQCSFTTTTSIRSCTLPTLIDGAWSVTAVITDTANNASKSTPPIVALIDTAAPVISATPFNAEDNGAGTSITATPKISLEGVPAGETATIYGVSTKSEKSTCSFIASETVNLCTMNTMPSGTWSLTADITDLAGNVSAMSSSTQIIISAGLAPITIAKAAVTPTPSMNKFENVVVVKFGTSAALAGVQTVSFIVQDRSGKVVRRTTVKMKPTDTGTQIVIPKSLKGAKVRVVTTNQCGVSDGAPKNFNVRPGKTSISINKTTNRPVLAGQLVLPQIDFAPSEITLDSSDKALLDKALKEMRGKCGSLLVSGFARHNTTDGKKYLQNLADFRALAVADYLSDKGLTMWIEYQGFVIRSDDKNSGVNRRVALYWTPA